MSDTSHQSIKKYEVKIPREVAENLLQVYVNSDGTVIIYWIPDSSNDTVKEEP